MTKRELVIAVAERLGYTQNEVSGVVQTTLDTITESLAEGQRLEVRNFGVFEVKTRDARMGRNPRTGEEVPITRKRVATFKPGKALKEYVQSGVRPAIDLEPEDDHFSAEAGQQSEAPPQQPDPYIPPPPPSDKPDTPGGSSGQLF